MECRQKFVQNRLTDSVAKVLTPQKPTSSVHFQWHHFENVLLYSSFKHIFKFSQKYEPTHLSFSVPHLALSIC